MTTVELLIAQAKWHRACETEAVFAAVESVIPTGKECELIADLALMLMRMGRPG